MPLLGLLTWIWIYRRKALLDHRPMIMIVSGYTLSKNNLMENPDQSEWVPTSLWENPIRYSPKESVTDLSDLVFIWDVIVVLWFSTHFVFTGVLSDKPGYESSLVTMSAQTCTGQICLPFHHWVNVVLLTPLSCVLNVRETFPTRYRRPLLCGSLRRFL